jgi:hypothetical protein
MNPEIATANFREYLFPVSRMDKGKEKGRSAFSSTPAPKSMRGKRRCVQALVPSTEKAY